MTMNILSVHIAKVLVLVLSLTICSNLTAQSTDTEAQEPVQVLTQP